MPTGGEHGEIVMTLGTALVNFARPRRLGRIAGSDSGVLLERDPDTVREPDLAFFSTDTIPAGVRVTGYYEVVPDIVGEVVSPNDTAREIDDKARMWIRYGTGLVWVLNPDTRTVAVYSPRWRGDCSGRWRHVGWRQCLTGVHKQRRRHFRLIGKFRILSIYA